MPGQEFFWLFVDKLSLGIKNASDHCEMLTYIDKVQGAGEKKGLR